MLIWGSKARKTDIASGEFFCPNCATNRPYKRKRVSKYFTLYFVPLFETDNLGEYIECQVCQEGFKPAVLNYEPPSAAEQVCTAVQRELEGGMPFHMLQKKLISLGLDDDGAMKIINAVAGEFRRKCPTCGFEYIGKIESCGNCGSSLKPTQQESFGTMGVNAMSFRTGNSAHRTSEQQSPMSAEVRTLYVELQDDSSKRRWNTIQKLGKMNVRNEQILMKIAEMAIQDPRDYVRAEAQKYIDSPGVQSLVQGIQRRGRVNQQGIEEIGRILSSRGLI